MEFDGVETESRELRVGTTFHWVIANLMASKDTIKILGDLNRAYPFAKTEAEKRVQEAFGADNSSFIREAVSCLESGNAPALGELMTRAQENFDRKVMPFSDELKAPVLHSVLTDANIRQWVFGAKGVGSQGDGTVQFLARSESDAEQLQAYLLKTKGMPSFTLTLKPGQTVKKAVIPLAGFGTRVFPATKCIRKCFMPLLDSDGLLKPALMIMLERLLDAGIEEVALVIGEEEQEEFDRFFSPLPEEHREKLPADKQKCEEKILEMRQHITYIHQQERKGFGHAVWLTRKFADRDPVLLLLGDFVYRSNTADSCCKQVLAAYKECGRPLVSITEIPLNRVVHYGILSGIWNENESMMKVERMVEKPTDDYAREYLGVKNTRGETKYYATFGQYVLTPDVFDELDQEIHAGTPSEGMEYGLTVALDKVREKNGLYGFVPDGQSFDIGLPDTYRRTMWEFPG